MTHHLSSGDDTTMPIIDIHGLINPDGADWPPIPPITDHIGLIEVHRQLIGLADHGAEQDYLCAAKLISRIAALLVIGTNDDLYALTPVAVTEVIEGLRTEWPEDQNFLRFAYAESLVDHMAMVDRGHRMRSAHAAHVAQAH